MIVVKYYLYFLDLLGLIAQMKSDQIENSRNLTYWDSSISLDIDLTFKN